MRNRKFQKNSKKSRKIKKYRDDFISSQNGLQRAEKETKQKLSFHFLPTLCVIENSKKIAKKFEKLKNTILASFEVKIGWKRSRTRENKNYRSFPFQPHP